MGPIVLPVAFIDISISVDKSALAVGHTILRVALVDRAITPNLMRGEYLFAFSMFEAVFPLAYVDGTAFKLIRTKTREIRALCHHLLVTIVLERPESLKDRFGVGIVNFRYFLRSIRSTFSFLAVFSSGAWTFSISFSLSFLLSTPGVVALPVCGLSISNYATIVRSWLNLFGFQFFSFFLGSLASVL